MGVCGTSYTTYPLRLGGWINTCNPEQQKVHQCRPSLFRDNEQNSVQNIKKIKGNTHFVNVVLPKVSLQF